MATSKGHYLESGLNNLKYHIKEMETKRTYARFYIHFDPEEVIQILLFLTLKTAEIFFFHEQMGDDPDQTKDPTLLNV